MEGNPEYHIGLPMTTAVVQAFLTGGGCGSLITMPPIPLASQSCQWIGDAAMRKCRAPGNRRDPKVGETAPGPPSGPLEGEEARLWPVVGRLYSSTPNTRRNVGCNENPC